MKHLFNILPKLTAIAAIALSASSCNRAEYAMLPKTTSYHGTQRAVAVKPAPVATPASPEMEAPATPEAVAPAVVAPVAVEKSAVATPPTVTSSAARIQPLSAAPAKAKSVASVTTLRKSNLVQRLAIAKALKQVDKATTRVQIKQRSETASTKRLEGKLRQGIILMLLGILLGIFSGFGTIGAIIGLIGAILFLIGAVLVILYLLDEL